MTLLPFPRLHIGAFRGLRDLTLEECGPINLLVGSNNSGKTSVLEALLLLSNPTDPGQWERAVELRKTWPLADVVFPARVGRIDAIAWMFPHNGGVVGDIEISSIGGIAQLRARADRITGEPPVRPSVSRDEIIEGSYLARRHQRESEGEVQEPRAPLVESGLSIELELHERNQQVSLFDGVAPRRFHIVFWETGSRLQLSKLSRNPTSSVGFASPIGHRSDGYLVERVSQIFRAKRQERTIELLKRLDPRVVDIEILTPDKFESTGGIPPAGAPPTIHIEYADVGLVPVHAMGDGMRRALHLAALVAELGDGDALLIDEIEVGMHPSVLRDVFGWLCSACRNAGIQIFATTHSLEAVDAILKGVESDDLVVYRLGNGTARRLGGELLEVSRMELGQEIR